MKSASKRFESANKKFWKIQKKASERQISGKLLEKGLKLRPNTDCRKSCEPSELRKMPIKENIHIFRGEELCGDTETVEGKGKVPWRRWLRKVFIFFQGADRTGGLGLCFQLREPSNCLRVNAIYEWWALIYSHLSRKLRRGTNCADNWMRSCSDQETRKVYEDLVNRSRTVLRTLCKPGKMQKSECGYFDVR